MELNRFSPSSVRLQDSLQFEIPDKSVPQNKMGISFVETRVSGWSSSSALLADDIVSKVKAINNKLVSRLNAHDNWQQIIDSGMNGPAPAFIDESGLQLHPLETLKPCEVVNAALSELVELTLEPVNVDQVSNALLRLKNDTSNHVELSRTLSMRGEEALEKDALKLIFAIEEEMGDHELMRQVGWHVLNYPRQGEPLSIARFRALAQAVPLSVENDPAYQGIGSAFKYFDNYVEIVQTELKLLTQPLPGTEQPVFTPSSLQNKRFAFVGAGFPLTAIVLHGLTGAPVTLIDVDPEAVANGRRLLSLCERLGITKENALNVVHADAREVNFLPVNEEYLTGEGIEVRVDVLDLASALPSDVTRQVIEQNVQGDVVIRKRNVRKLSELLYEPYQHDQSASRYKVVASVVPPQQSPVNPQERDLIIAHTSPINVNACDLLLPASLTSGLNEALKRP